MKHTKITFRGIEPEDSLEPSVHQSVKAIREGLPSSSHVRVDVVISRVSPKWAGSTAVRVTLSVDGWEHVESARAPEPRSAVQECFSALGRRLRRRAVKVDAIDATEAHAWSALWGPQGTF